MSTVRSIGPNSPTALKGEKVRQLDSSISIRRFFAASTALAAGALTLIGIEKKSDIGLLAGVTTAVGSIAIWRGIKPLREYRDQLVPEKESNL